MGFHCELSGRKAAPSVGGGVRMQEEENWNHELSRVKAGGMGPARDWFMFQTHCGDSPITQLFPVTGESQ